jgi:type I restriction enzyme S subunit
MIWPRTRLDECTRIVSGATPKTGIPEFWDGDICWVTPKDLSELEGPFIDTTPRKITARGLASCAAEVLPAGSVLFSSRAPIGHVAISRVPMATNQGFKSFIPNASRLHAGFLFWWLKCHRAYLEGLGNGATFKEVSKSVVARIEIPLPPLAEQHRIAAILDAADVLRTKRDATIRTLNALPQSIFIEMFGNPVGHTSAYHPLGQYLRFITSGGRGWAKFYSSNGSRFIRSLDVQMNHIGSEDAIFVEPPDNAEADRTRVEAGDVLLTITDSRIGRVAPVPEELKSAYVSQHVAILRPDKKVLLPVFLSFFLSLSSGGQYQIARAQYGQTKPGLNFEQIRRFQLPVPPIEEQERFCRLVAQVAHVQETLRASRRYLDALFVSLKNRAFCGELTWGSEAGELAEFEMAG